jgi:peptide/nickel transport system substrate-binding protein
MRRLTRRAAIGGALAGALLGRSLAAQTLPYGIPRISLPDFPTWNEPEGTGSAWARLLATSTILGVNEDGSYTGGLAAVWSLSRDRTVLDFDLRLDAMFSDATPVIAADLVASLERARARMAETPEAWRWERVESFAALAPHHLRMVLAQPDASIPALLASHHVPVYPAVWAGREWDAAGPFPPSSGCFAIDYVNETRLGYSRNDAYYQIGRPRLAGVLCNAPSDSLSRTTELVTRAADLLIDVPLLDLPMLREDPDISLVGGPSNRLCFLQANLRNGPLADPQLRRLLASAIDRAQLVQSATAGEAVPASALIPASHWAGLDYTIDERAADDVRARLEVLGQPPGVELHLIASGASPLLANACVLLQEQLAWAGIALSLELLEGEEMALTLRDGSWDLHMALSSFWRDPHELVRPLLASDGVANVGGYENSRIDYLTTLASRSRTEAYRAGFYRTIQQIVANELPVIPLFFPHYFDAMSPKIEGYKAFPPVSAAAMRSATMPQPQPIRRT